MKLLNLRLPLALLILSSACGHIKSKVVQEDDLVGLLGAGWKSVSLSGGSLEPGAIVGMHDRRIDRLGFVGDCGAKFKKLQTKKRSVGEITLTSTSSRQASAITSILNSVGISLGGSSNSTIEITIRDAWVEYVDLVSVNDSINTNQGDISQECFASLASPTSGIVVQVLKATSFAIHRFDQRGGKLDVAVTNIPIQGVSSNIAIDSKDQRNIIVNLSSAAPFAVSTGRPTLASRSRLELPFRDILFSEEEILKSLTIRNVGETPAKWRVASGPIDLFKFMPSSGTLIADDEVNIRIAWDSCLANLAPSRFDLRSKETNQREVVIIRTKKKCPNLALKRRYGSENKAFQTFFRGMDQLRLGKYEQAAATIEEAVRMEPELNSDPEYALYVGLARLKVENRPGALVAFKSVSKGNPIGFVYAAIVEKQRGRNVEATAELQNLRLNLTEEFKLEIESSVQMNLGPDEVQLISLEIEKMKKKTTPRVSQ